MSGPFTKPEGVIIIDEPKPVLMMGTNRVGKSSMRQTMFNRIKDMTGDEPIVCIQSRLSFDRELEMPNLEQEYARRIVKHRIQVQERVLTEALGSHVISVLRQYPERAAEYLRNWHTECRIYHDRCVVTRRGEVIAEGVF